ncbi:hypothetical protein L1987_79095 [Smallanthus sonchifolius]|uniref:Uncharacterized protein n=1 Tax=Smallanthus sonchifolius TaxID=185202 RepID=A0ACB8ZFK2_9ASTR|nr:hypothetical protein L1987_79095 [Smallanthus sonchifolius]
MRTLIFNTQYFIITYNLYIVSLLDMDSYSPSSPVYRPGAESDWEEDIGSPVHRTPTPAAARPRTMGIPINDIHQYVRTVEFERQRMENEVMHDLQGQRMDSLANQLGYQKELISILEKEILEHRTETAKAEARSATRVTIAVLALGIIFLLVESYQRR